MTDKYQARLDSEKKLLEVCQLDPSQFKQDALVDLLSVTGTRVDATDESGMTGLMHAAYKGNVQACRLLLHHGADVNCNLHEHFYSALMFGTMSGSVLTVNLLLEAGAKVSTTNRNRRTAAQLGAFVGHHTCVTAINNFLSMKELEYYTKPHDLEVVSKLPSCALQPLHRILITTNLHPVYLMNYYGNNLVLCQHHTRVSTTLEDLCAKQVKEMNDAMALKVYYILFMLKAFIKYGASSFLSRCLTQRVSDGSYVERDAFLRECLKEYPHIQSPLWKQMVASASKVPVGGTPTVLSMLYSAIIGQNDGTEEECSNCGTTGIQLRKCSKCKVAMYCDINCQKQSWEFGSHKKMCKKFQSESS